MQLTAEHLEKLIGLVATSSKAPMPESLADYVHHAEDEVLYIANAEYWGVTELSNLANQGYVALPLLSSGLVNLRSAMKELSFDPREFLSTVSHRCLILQSQMDVAEFQDRLDAAIGSGSVMRIDVAMPDATVRTVYDFGHIKNEHAPLTEADKLLHDLSEALVVEQGFHDIYRQIIELAVPENLAKPFQDALLSALRQQGVSTDGCKAFGDV